MNKDENNCNLILGTWNVRKTFSDTNWLTGRY